MNCAPIRLGNTAAWLAVAGTLLVAGCSNLPSLPGASTAPAPAPATPGTGTKAPPPAAASGGINLVGECKQKEIDGFEEDANVVVQNGRIRNLTWRMRIGRRGTCSFDGEDFRQTRMTPSIELKAKDGSGCRLLMWADPRRVTLAHNNCAKFCTAGVYDKAWPVMFDPGTGGCADNNR
jgi:hypothetical protein